MKLKNNTTYAQRIKIRQVELRRKKCNYEKTVAFKSQKMTFPLPSVLVSE